MAQYQKSPTARKPYARKQTPQQQLAAAIDRAQASNVTVAGAGTLANNKPFWIVPSQSVVGMHHVVTQVGKSLQCDCFAAQNGRVCVHRAAVYLYLTSKAKEAVNQARAVATAPVKSARPPVDQEAPQAPANMARCVDCAQPCTPDRTGRCAQCALAPAPHTHGQVRGDHYGFTVDEPDDDTDMDYYATYANYYR